LRQLIVIVVTMGVAPRGLKVRRRKKRATVRGVLMLIAMSIAAWAARH
jgi:hypothetical protein